MAAMTVGIMGLTGKFIVVKLAALSLTVFSHFNISNNFGCDNLIIVILWYARIIIYFIIRKYIVNFNETTTI